MNRYKTDLLDLRCMDCMDLLKQTPDKHYSLCIVDPPYGIGEDGGKSKSRDRVGAGVEYASKEWDKNRPAEEYFNELRRVSLNQIIWGANYYPEKLHASMGWVFWDKEASGDFSEGELAFTSFDRALRIFKFAWMGMRQGDMKNKEKRIHPTQKPVALYKWLLHNYAKPGDTILDTHGGSMSIAIACHYAGYNLTLTEMDPDYFKAGVERVKLETAQRDMFTEGLI
jgi:site-specific DNA-methyltransferase (adenine-specific)